MPTTYPPTRCISTPRSRRRRWQPGRLRQQSRCGRVRPQIRCPTSCKQVRETRSVNGALGSCGWLQQRAQHLLFWAGSYAPTLTLHHYYVTIDRVFVSIFSLFIRFGQHALIAVTLLAPLYHVVVEPSMKLRVSLTFLGLRHRFCKF